MCGIAGSYQIDPSCPATGERIHSALQAIAHRGPDDEGVHVQGRAVLGHRRLSIIDTSPAGHQPFTDNGGRYTIVYNGEVFNYQELRAGLEAKGHTFRSQSDTEVILRLYAVKGEAFLHDLNGFFALAIHDAENDSLFVARDRYGIKPLVWCEAEGAFLFASELGALQVLNGTVTVDLDSLRQYLRFHYIAGPHTILKSVLKLEPGHLLRVDANGVYAAPWYALSTQVKRRSMEKPTEHLHQLMEDAVQRRLIADVPVGSFLSGGLDSSIVTALAARHHTDIQTFSIGFSDDPYFDESRYAEEVARHVGTRHHAFRLSTDDLAEDYEGFLATVDEPFADSSAFPFHLLCARTRPHVTVALSGDGADELFGGYRKHQAELRLMAPGLVDRLAVGLGPLWRALPRSRNHRLSDLFRKLDRFAQAGSAPPEERWSMLATLDGDGDAPSLVPGGVVPPARIAHMARGVQALVGMNGMLLADMLTVLPYDMLHKTDIYSMAHGLEVRPPFLDRRVVEFAFGLQAHETFRRGTGKALLRDTFSALVPPSVITRRKQGFEVPLLRLFTGPLAKLVDHYLQPDRLQAAGIDPVAARAVRDRMHSTRPGQAEATIHALLVLLAWWERRMI